MEEILYLLTIQMHPDNPEPVALLFAGPESCREYFQEVDRFLVDCLGEEVRQLYQVIIGSPAEVGRSCRAAIEKVHKQLRPTSAGDPMMTW